MNSETNAIINDLTSGSVAPKLLRFAWPLMVSNLLQTFYNMVDMIIVGQFVGTQGLSAVSNGGDIIHLMTMICMGFSSAGQVLISQHVGTGDRIGMKRTIGNLFGFMAAFSLCVMVAGLLLTDWSLAAINVPLEVRAEARAYSIYCFWGMLFIYGYNTVSATLRGMGDSKRPLLFIAIASVSNLVLDLLFVAGMGMGVRGAALATVLGQAISFVCSIVYLCHHKEAFGFDFALESFAPHPATLRRLLSLGIPMALQHAAISISRLFVNSFINSYGVVASAVNGIGGKIRRLSMIVSNSLATAATSMIGQSFGAGKKDRIVRVIYIAWGIALCYTALLSLIVILFPDWIFGLFDDTPAVLELAHSYIIIAVLSFNANAVRAPMMALVNGLGNSRLSLLIGILDGIVARVLMAILLGVVLNMGIMGFWLGDVFAGYVPFLIGSVYFWSGAWKKREPLVAPPA